MVRTSSRESRPYQVPKSVYLLESLAFVWAIILVPLILYIPSNGAPGALVSKYVDGKLITHYVTNQQNMFQVNGDIVFLPVLVAIVGVLLVLLCTVLYDKGRQFQIDVVLLIIALLVAIVGIIIFLTIGIIVIPITILLLISRGLLGRTSTHNTNRL